jgi:quinol monooxygenase YgiN
MPILVHARIHGLGGRAGELRDVLAAHAEAMAAAPGSLGAVAASPLTGEAAEFVLHAAWADEEALRAHYATPEYARYAREVGELLAQPSDVAVHYVERTVRPRGDASLDPTRLG